MQKLYHLRGESGPSCLQYPFTFSKPKSCMVPPTDTLEARFNNCYLLSSVGYIVPNSKEEQAILCGVYENNTRLDLRVRWKPGVSLDKVIEEAGWIDPNVSLDTGLGEMLKKGWPELHERALSREITPFEALLETGCVGPRTVYEVLRSDEDLLTELDDICL